MAADGESVAPHLPGSIGGGRRIILAGLLANVVLAGLQVFGGLVGHSRAVLADGVHSTSDILIGLLVLVGLGIGRRPPDESHPFGHGKAESIAAFLVGLAITAAAVELVRSGLHGVATGVPQPPDRLPLLVATISIAAKVVLYRATMRVGRALGSPAVLAAGREYLSCIASSTAAAAGILGAWWGYPEMDSLAALVVAVFVLKAAAQTVWLSVRDLMDAALSAEQVRGLRRAARRVPGVEQVAAVRTRRTGSQRQVDVEVCVAPELAVDEGDRIAAGVRTELLAVLSRTDQVRVAVAPAAPLAGRRREVVAAIRSIVESQAHRFVAYEGPRMTRLGRELCADLTLVVSKDQTVAQTYALCTDLEAAIRSYDAQIEVVIRLQPAATPQAKGTDRT